MIPRVAIPHPTSDDHAYNRLNLSPYTDALRACGVEPVEIALTIAPADLTRVAASCHAILLPGSPADVDPSRYGQPRDEACAPADLQRETVDLFLLEHAYATGRPIFGICFGAQMLNVLRGGTLIQDLSILPVNHSAGRSVAIAHSASIAPGSLLGSIIDPDEAPEVDDYLRLPINSSHHQAVGVPGAGLRISARCPQDAVIEAIEGPWHLDLRDRQHFVLGVQWHPERSFDTSPSSRLLFERVAREAAIFASANEARISEKG